jgi:hypothetical protein
MIQAQTISVTLKTEIQQRIDDTVIANLHLKTNTPQRTIINWLKDGSDRLTHYSFLLALSEILNIPIPQLINIHRS